MRKTLCVFLALTFTVIILTEVHAESSHYKILESYKVLENNTDRESSILPLNVISKQKLGLIKDSLSSQETVNGIWLRDPISGCGVWNSENEENVSISWSGGCQDGKASGSGVLVWLENGKIVGRFKGTMSNGKAQGYGKLDFEVDDGFAHYEGEFRSSEIHGRGVLEFPDKSRVEGDFSHDKMNGFIKATITEGGSYEGEVSNNMPHGKGLQITPEGEEYYGEFIDGEREGKGTLLLTNGDIYEGQFKDDLANGFGALSTAEEGSFKGQFKDGLPNGEGIFTDLNGDVAKGNFIDGEPDGKIIFTMKRGKTKEEIWKNGKKL